MKTYRTLVKILVGVLAVGAGVVKIMSSDSNNISTNTNIHTQKVDVKIVLSDEIKKIMQGAGATAQHTTSPGAPGPGAAATQRTEPHTPPHAVAQQQVVDTSAWPRTAVLAFDRDGRVPDFHELALSYRVIVDRGGQAASSGIVGMSDAESADQPVAMRAGERFRFAIRVSDDASVRVVHQSASGQAHVLFPHPAVNDGSDRLAAGVELLLPTTGWLSSDLASGLESVTIAIATGAAAQTAEGSEFLAATRPGAVLAADHWRDLLRRATTPLAGMVSEGRALRMRYRDFAGDTDPTDYAAVRALDPLPVFVHTFTMEIRED